MALLDRAGAARAPLLRELVAGKRLPRSSEKRTPPFPGRAPSGPGACLLLWVGLEAGEEQATLFRRFPRLRAALFFFWGGGVTGSATLHVTPPFPPSSARRLWNIQGSLLSFVCCDVDLQSCTVRLRVV